MQIQANRNIILHFWDYVNQLITEKLRVLFFLLLLRISVPSEDVHSIPCTLFHLISNLCSKPIIFIANAHILCKKSHQLGKFKLSGQPAILFQIYLNWKTEKNLFRGKKKFTRGKTVKTHSLNVIFVGEKEKKNKNPEINFNWTYVMCLCGVKLACYCNLKMCFPLFGLSGQISEPLNG